MENRKTIKIIVAALIAALLLAGACAVMGRFITPPDAADGDDAAAAIKTMTGRTAEVKCGDTVATAFVYKSVEGGALTVTCWHAVKGDAPSAQFRFYGEDLFVSGATLQGYDPDYDIAVFWVPTDKNFDPPQIYSASVGEEAFLLGNSDGDGIALFSGRVSVPDDIVHCTDGQADSNLNNKNLPAVRITAPVNNGCSGSPVFDAKGRLIGMGFYQVFGTAERPVYDMNYAVPAEIIASAVRVCEISGGRIDRSGVTLTGAITGEGDDTLRVYEARFDELWLNTVFRRENGAVYAYSGEEKKKVLSLAGKPVTTIAQLLAAAMEYEYFGGEPVTE